jgi:hypothetical protein
MRPKIPTLSHSIWDAKMLSIFSCAANFRSEFVIPNIHGSESIALPRDRAELHSHQKYCYQFMDDSTSALKLLGARI